MKRLSLALVALAAGCAGGPYQAYRAAHSEARAELLRALGGAP